MSKSIVSEKSWSDSWSLRSALDNLVDRLLQEIPGLPIEEVRRSGFTEVRIPTAPESAYEFSVALHDDLKDASVSAILLGVPTDTYFWHVVTEHWDYDSFEEMWDRITTIAASVARRPTKVAMRKGLLFASFKLEVMDPQNTVIPGSTAFRYGNFRFPSNNREALFVAKPWRGNQQ